MRIMKRTLLLVVIIGLVSIRAIAQEETIVYDVFASATSQYNYENLKQDFIKVKMKGNCFYWGDRNAYSVYNKKVTHDGFKATTVYDFVDKYGQRGRLFYCFDESADWSTRNLFMISYEGTEQCMMFLSNDAKKE